MARWQTKSSQVVYENPWIIVREDQVIRPDGSDGLYGYIEPTSNAVFIVPIDADGNTYIIQQERYTSKNITWECVAGRTDNEAVKIAAKRELLEETGLSAQSITVLAELNTANSISTSKSTVCVARDLEKVTDQLDEIDGIIAIKKLPLSDVKQMIVNGEITCSESVAAFFLVINYLESSK